MKAKLILKHRGDYDYFLLSRTKNSEAVQASLIPNDEFEQKISKQNCDEIFGVVNVENLAENHPLEVSNASHGFGIEDGIVYGFNKAMELNKDKVFTLGDIKEVIKKARLLARLKEDYGYDEYMFDEEDIIQSIQQPTEIEVVIEVTKSDDIKSVEKDWYKIGEPKLDENGCLILKRA